MSDSMMSRRSPEAERSRARSPRFELDTTVEVAAKTIGSNICFYLQTRMVSKSGLLLCTDPNMPVPFRDNTILVLKIDTRQGIFSQPVTCLARVIGFRGLDGTQLGVSIVQIDSSDHYHWDSYLTKVAERASFEQRTYDKAVTNN